MKEILETIIESLIPENATVSVTEIPSEKETKYEVRVSKGDMGRVIGKNGKNTLAITRDKTSPKLKLVASLIYFIRFTKVRLPSVTPSNRTFKSFSNNIISADSLAISTAVSTEIPTSDFVSEGLSFIPSPI